MKNAWRIVMAVGITTAMALVGIFVLTRFDFGRQLFARATS